MVFASCLTFALSYATILFERESEKNGNIVVPEALYLKMNFNAEKCTINNSWESKITVDGSTIFQFLEGNDPTQQQLTTGITEVPMTMSSDEDPIHFRIFELDQSKSEVKIQIQVFEHQKSNDILSEVERSAATRLIQFEIEEIGATAALEANKKRGIDPVTLTIGQEYCVVINGNYYDQSSAINSKYLIKQHETEKDLFILYLSDGGEKLIDEQRDNIRRQEEIQKKRQLIKQQRELEQQQVETINQRLIV